jgi:prepilin peptidase dependent protein B
MLESVSVPHPPGGLTRSRPGRGRLGSNQRGLGLVELLISATIGLFLLAGLTDFLGRSLITAGRNFQDARLTQDLNAAMELMTRDLRRAGYSSAAQGTLTASDAAANPFTQDAVAGAGDGGINLTTAGCVLYAYDLPNTQNGTRDSTERLGFKLQGGVVQAGTGVTTCTAVTGWQPVTDPAMSEITLLNFEYLDGTGAVANPQQPFAASTGAAWVVCTRLIQLTLTGRLVNNPTVTRTLTHSVRVRNDWYRNAKTTCA